MEDEKKPSIISSGELSLAMLILLYINAKENPQEKLSDAYEIMIFIFFLLFSVSVIWIWHKYLKEYIVFIIDDKSQEMNKE